MKNSSQIITIILSVLFFGYIFYTYKPMQKTKKPIEEKNVAFDIGSYRSAPPGLRIWGGPTVENDDIKKLLPWLDWAYHKSLSDLDI